MTIGGIGGNRSASSSAVSMSSNGTDSYSKSLQKQIADAQKQLQELSGNEEMSAEIKMKKRQEIQKQISDLNMQLRQHQMEERRKAQQERQAKRQPKKEQEKQTGLSKGSMEAMISAEGSLSQAKQQGSVANKMQNSADIRRMEIQRDGGSTKRTANDSAAISSKWDDVEGMEQKSQAATASQMSLLAKARDEISKAGAESSMGTETDKTDKKNSVKTQDQNASSTKTDKNNEAAADISVETVDEAAVSTGLFTEIAADPASPVLSKQSVAIGSNVDVKI